MTVTAYYSSDASAPQINNVAGAGLPIFDALLVNGYGGKPGQGWSLVTQATPATNVHVYQQPAGTNGRYLWVDDSNANYISIQLFESSSDGTFSAASRVNPTPAVYLYKGNANTQKQWVAVGNDNILHFLAYWYAAPTSLNGTYSYGLSVGDLQPTKADDVWNTYIFGNAGSSYSNTENVYLASPGNTYAGHSLLRSYTQTGSAIQFGKTAADYSKINSSNSLVMGITGLAFPNPEDGGLYLTPLDAYHSSSYRGRIPGMWVPCHVIANTGFAHLDQIAGTGDLAGKTFQVAFCNGGSNPAGGVMLEISNTW